jgi:hypothetical protein
LGDMAMVRGILQVLLKIGGGCLLAT